MPIRADFDLNNRIVIVTGALGKLGHAFCEALLHANARVAALDLPRIEPTPRFRDLQRLFPGRLELFAGDVCDRDSLESAHDAIRSRFGCPSVLVNNAGIDQPPGKPVRTYRLEEIPTDICRGILDVNVLGVFLCTQVFLPSLRESGRGAIINIGSLYASVSPDARFYDHLSCDPPFLKPPMYGASKAAVVNLTKYLAAHLGPAGVRVNALSPGGVAGGQDEQFIRKFCDRVPLGRMAKLEDLAGPLVFLASDASAYVTGIELRVDGGFTAW
ncbi:MAG: SDR family oxidoreductase [Gemmatales bacterium]|nr:SDR family oxidoreductase [Gemmatales bacterium]MDW8385625.1 SDR family oxidoreductase [Gemmatales bacterium]